MSPVLLEAGGRFALDPSLTHFTLCPFPEPSNLFWQQQHQQQQQQTEF